MRAGLDIEHAMDVARRAVMAGGEIALGYQRRGVRVEQKPDGSPVTVADRDAEAAILRVLLGAFPGHDVLAEEGGTRETGADARWIVDPLDGTHGFTRGGTCWGPLVALEHRGELVVGAMALPAHGKVYWAGRGHGAWRNGQPVRISGVMAWDRATLSLGGIRRLLAPPHGAGVEALMRTAARTRCLGDVASCAMLLDGEAEAWLEAGVKLWDLAAGMVLVEEAGGRATDFEGGCDLSSGRIAAASGPLHAHVLAAVRGG
jgi:histidinol-phosphatase